MVAPSISFSQTRATKFELYCREREREREIILLQQQHNITCNKPNYMGNRFSGGAKYTAGGKNLRFSTEIAVYLGNSARRGPLYFLVVLVCVCAWYAFILLQLDVADCTEGTYVHKMKNQKPKKISSKKVQTPHFVRQNLHLETTQYRHRCGRFHDLNCTLPENVYACRQFQAVNLSSGQR